MAQACSVAYTLWLDELVEAANATRVAAAVGAAFGGNAKPPPSVDEIRAELDGYLATPMEPGSDGLSSHDKELYAALGIGR